MRKSKEQALAFVEGAGVSIFARFLDQDNEQPVAIQMESCRTISLLLSMDTLVSLLSQQGAAVFIAKLAGSSFEVLELEALQGLEKLLTQDDEDELIIFTKLLSSKHDNILQSTLELLLKRLEHGSEEVVERYTSLNTDNQAGQISSAPNPSIHSLLKRLTSTNGIEKISSLSSRVLELLLPSLE